MAAAIDLQSDNAVNIERLNLVKGLIDEAITVVEQLYIPDLLAVASFYKEWAGYGGGLGNYMSYGTCPRTASAIPPSSACRAASSSAGTSPRCCPGPVRRAQVQEEVAHSGTTTRRARPRCTPGTGSRRQYTGPKPPYENLDGDKAYSCSSPALAGNAMEVGPLARMLVGYASGSTSTRRSSTRRSGSSASRRRRCSRPWAGTAARARDQLCARWLRAEYEHLIANLKAGDSASGGHLEVGPEALPKECKGFGFTEAPRGALGHWCHIQDGKLASYQIVVPSTWNASPKDGKASTAPTRPRSSARHGRPPSARSRSCAPSLVRPGACLCLARARPDGRVLSEVVVR